MNMQFRAAAISMTLAVTALVTPTVASAAPLAARTTATCALYAEQPTYNGSINGWGHWLGCPATARITVVMREDRRFWFDRTLRSGTAHGSYGSKLLVYACGNHFDPIKVFIEVRYGDKKVQSPRAVLPCA
jgi:hypothetical protein